MPLYEIIVSNIGLVFSGDCYTAAVDEYLEYVQLSESGYGRFAGENVTLMCDGEVIFEYRPE